MYAHKEDRHADLRRWAKGTYDTEAGVELLIRSGWDERLDQGGWIDNRSGQPGVGPTEGTGYAYPRVGLFLASGGYLSGGERKQVATIASFLGQKLDEDAGQIAVVLANTMNGVDHSFIRLVQSAVGHTAGMHESGGNPLPWPGEHPHWKPEVSRG